MIGKEEKDKGKERIHPLHSTEEVGSSADDMPALIAEEAFIKTALQAYYQSQSTFRQGLSERQESITQSFINLSIISRDLQQQKEEMLAQEGEPQEEREDVPDGKAAKTKTKEVLLRDERLASYEALRTNPEPIALEDLFKQDVSSSRINQRLLVLGRAGIGKTTLSQHIAYRWAMNDLWPQFTYVFWLPLRNLNQGHYQTVSDINLAVLIRQECFKQAPIEAITVDAIQAILADASSKTLFILDGYDEVAHLIGSENALDHVLQQALAFPNLIITTRPYAIPDSQLFERSLEVMGFTEDNILAYVSNYFNDKDVALSQEVEPLQQFLKTNPNIWGTAHVPINLALICNAWEEAIHQGETLNVRLTMTGLYHNLVQALLKRAVARQGNLIYEVQPQWLEQQNKRATQLLAALAAQGLAKQQIILNAELQQQAYASLKLNEDEAKLALSEAVSLGLLQPIGGHKAQATSYYFIHLTFQEFFAARYYVHGLQKASDSNVHQEALTFIREHKYNPFYQLVFWFMAGLISASEKERPLILFWQTLLAEPHDVLGFAHLRLLIHCLDEAQIDKRILQRDNLLHYLGRALDVVVLGRKLSFFASLTKMVNHDPVAYALEQSFSEFLLTELSHTSFLSQDQLFFNQLVVLIKQNRDTARTIRAIEVLDKLNLIANAVDLICERAVRDKDGGVRSTAIKALGKLVHPSAKIIDLLCERAGQDERVREAAIDALSKLAHSFPAVIDLLCKRAGQGEEKGVRRAAIKAIGNLNNPSPAVINLLCEWAGQDEGVGQAAIEALCNFNNLSPAVIDLLCKRAGQDEEKGVRRAAIQALCNLNNPSPAITDLLCEWAGQDKDVGVRKAAITALGNLNNLSPAVIDLFCKLVRQDEEKGVRRAAIQALCNLNNPSPAVISLLCEWACQDKETGVRRAAIKALGNLNNPPPVVIDLLWSAIQGQDKNGEKQAAIEALCKLNNPSAAVIGLLCERAVQDKNVKIRQATIEALGNLNNPSPVVIGVLCERTWQDKSIEVKQSAIYALGKLVNPPSTVIELLCERVGQDVGVRQAAITALGNLNNPSPAVIDLLCERAGQDEEEGVRQAAITALGNLNDPSPAVIDLLCERAEQDEKEGVRQAAIAALSKLVNPSPAVINLICEWLKQNEDNNGYYNAVKLAALFAFAPGAYAFTPVPYALMNYNTAFHNTAFPVISVWMKQFGKERVKQTVIEAISELAKRSPTIIYLLCKLELDKIMTFIPPTQLLKAYLDCSNQDFGPLLASCIAKSVMRYQSGLTVSGNKLIIYTHHPFVFELLSKQSLQLVKELLNACQTMRQTYRLPQVVDLNKLSLSLIEESMLRVQEKGITFLSLHAQGLQDSQIKRLVELMSVYPALQSVDLSNNDITDVGASYLAKALVGNDYLTELHLAHNQLSNSGALALLQALAGNTTSITKANFTLCQLELGNHHRINKKTLDAIHEKLKRNQQLAQASQRLLKSIKRNDLTAIKQSLNEGALLTSSTKQGHGPLHVAACFDQQKVIEYLLTRYPACLNSFNRNGMTAFYLACVNGHWGLVQYLLKRGTDVNVRDYQGRSALHHAVINPELNVLKYLLFDPQVKPLININLPDNEGQTPLHYAVLAQNERNVRLLLKAGVDPSLINQQGKTALMIASEQSNPRIIGYLNNAQFIQPSASAALTTFKPENWVKVYFWPSQFKQLSLGHIALETTHFYGSFWPQNYRLQDGLKAVDSALAGSVEEDIQAEQLRKPQVYCFYSLDNQEINAEFARFCNQPRQWALTGRKLSNTTQNCSGLVYDLLSAGGIDKLVSVDWLTNALPSPNALGELIQKAERAERKQYPITTTYTPTPSLRAQQQVSVKSQEEGQFTVTLVNQLTTKLDEQTKLHKEHWKNEELARQLFELKLEQRFLRLEQQLSAGFTFFPPSVPAEASTSGSVPDESTSSEEEALVNSP